MTIPFLLGAHNGRSHLFGRAYAEMPKRLRISLARGSALLTRKLSVITSSGFERLT